MVDQTKLEKIADNFVEMYLKDRPVMIYSLDIEMEDYLENEGLSKIKDNILQEYLERNSNGRKKVIDERLNLLVEGLYIRDKSLLLEYIQSIADPPIRELSKLVITSNKVIIRSFEEIEDVELTDSIMPNEWIYHKDMNSTEVSDYVLRYYDDLKQQDDID